MFGLESDKMTALWPNNSLTFTFYMTFSNSIPDFTKYVKEVFDPIFTFESDKMTALQPNDNVAFTFYLTFSKSISIWAYLVTDVFWFDV